MIDEELSAILPWELDGLKITVAGEELTLKGGQPIVVKKALYGYRRSPQLWQGHLTGEMKRTTMHPCKSEPTIFLHGGQGSAGDHPC